MSSNELPAPVTDAPSVTEPVAAEERSMEPLARPEGSPDAAEFAIDLKPPKGLEKEYAELNKHFRAAYLKNTSAKADELKQLAVEKDRIAQEVQQYKGMVEDLRQHPEKLSAYQQIWGQAAAPATAIPEFRDTAELVQFVKTQTLHEAQALMDQRWQQYQQTKAYEDKWVSAWSSVVENDPHAAPYRRLVRNELMDRESPYLKLYTGQNEVEVIERAVRGMRELWRKEMDQVKQDTIKTMKGKVTATTERPTKSTKTVTAGPATRDAVIAEVQEALGPPPGL